MGTSMAQSHTMALQRGWIHIWECQTADHERRQKALHSYHINSKGNIKLKNNILYRMFARLLSEDFSLHSPCKSMAQPNALDSFILLWS